MESALQKLKSKIFWFSAPALLGFFTWIVITIMSVNTNVAKYQSNEANSKANQEQLISTQKEVLVVARESRTFAMENNIILNDKADKRDLKDVDTRLRAIEFKVNKIYNTHYSVNYIKPDSLIYYSKESKKKIDTLIEIVFPSNDAYYTWQKH